MYNKTLDGEMATTAVANVVVCDGLRSQIQSKIWEKISCNKHEVILKS